MKELKQKILCFEAARWRGITEKGGDNKGQVVEMFQAVVNGVNQEAWCISFIQYCIKQVDDLYEQVELGMQPRSLLAKTESTLMLWNKTAAKFRGEPIPGSIVLWEHYRNGKRTGLGHGGIVIKVDHQNKKITTIEGNTSPTSKEIVREGDGVYEKIRPIGNVGNMRLLGFIRAW